MRDVVAGMDDTCGNWLTHWAEAAFKALKVIVVAQLAVILAPHALLAAFLYHLTHIIYSYFKPDYETALIKRYKRPIIGLRLCRKCIALRYSASGRRVQHYDDIKSLNASASGPCWLCRTIRDQFLDSLKHRETPPEVDFPDQLPPQSLLMWFAERTETNSGYLNHLRGQSMAIMDVVFHC
jgi:hypothetical protein